MSRRFVVAAIAAALVAGVAAPPAQAVPAAALVAGPAAGSFSLVTFDTDTPGTVSSVPVDGIDPAYRLRALDLRPATDELFAVAIDNGATDAGELYRIDMLTGQATLVGPGPFATDMPDAAFWDIDFNPGVDRIRLVNAADENLRINPDSGARSDGSGDTDLHPAGGAVASIAYDHVDQVGVQGMTTLFGLERSDNQLVTIGGPKGMPSPNGGPVMPVGPLGIVIAPGVTSTLDIGVDGVAWATFRDNVDSIDKIGKVDLTTGAYTHVRPLGLVPTGGFTLLPPRIVAVSPADVSVSEADGAALVKVARTGGKWGGPVTVDYSTAPGSAAAGADYVPVEGTLRFPAGVTERTIVVPVRFDSDVEQDETFTVTLANPSALDQIGTASATVSVANSTAQASGAAPLAVMLAPRSVRARALRRGVLVEAGCASACGVKLDLVSGKRRFGRVTGRLAKAGTRLLRLKASAKSRKRVAKALRRRKSVKLSIVGRFANPLGGAERVRKRSLRVRR